MPTSSKAAYFWRVKPSPGLAWHGIASAGNFDYLTCELWDAMHYFLRLASHRASTACQLKAQVAAGSQRCPACCVMLKSSSRSLQASITSTPDAQSPDSWVRGLLLTSSPSLSLGGSSLLICLSPLRFLGAGSRWSVGRLVILSESRSCSKHKISQSRSGTKVLGIRENLTIMHHLIRRNWNWSRAGPTICHADTFLFNSKLLRTAC